MKKEKLFGLISIFFLLFGFCLTGCQKTQPVNGNNEKKMTVAVTIVPEKTFAEAVCGDLMNVVVLVPPGSSPENYEPTPVQMEEFNDASVYFTVGVPAEEANILPRATEIEGLRIVSLQEEVLKAYPDRTFESGERDPHIWLSPKRAKIIVESMAREMSAIDPDHEQEYTKNASAFIEKLDGLDAEIEGIFKDVSNKKFIVFHPAFGYLADDYSLTMLALEEEGKEASPQHLTDMIDLAKQQNIKAIFYQEEIDSRQSQAFAEEIGGKTIELSPLSADYIKNLKNMAQLIFEVAK